MKVHYYLLLLIFSVLSCNSYETPYDGYYTGELTIQRFEKVEDENSNLIEQQTTETVPFIIEIEKGQFRGDWRKGTYEVKGEHIEFTEKSDHCLPNADCAYFLLTKVDYLFDLQEDSLKMQYDSDWYINYEERELRSTQFYKLKR